VSMNTNFHSSFLSVSRYPYSVVVYNSRTRLSLRILAGISQAFRDPFRLTAVLTYCTKYSVLERQSR
jgi:hypothetical protein